MQNQPIDKLHSIQEAAPFLGLRTTSIYAQIKAGKLQAIKIGSKTMIAESEIARFRANLQTIGRQSDAPANPSETA